MTIKTLIHLLKTLLFIEISMHKSGFPLLSTLMRPTKANQLRGNRSMEEAEVEAARSFRGGGYQRTILPARAEIQLDSFKLVKTTS
jgi:hypothetical protein